MIDPVVDGTLVDQPGGTPREVIQFIDAFGQLFSGPPVPPEQGVNRTQLGIVIQ